MIIQLKRNLPRFQLKHAKIDKVVGMQNTIIIVCFFIFSICDAQRKVKSSVIASKNF